MYMQNEKEIKEIMKNMDCPKGFSCYKSGFRSICKASNFGVESVIECLDEKPEECVFSHPYGHLHFCRCPLRNYVEERLSSKIEYSIRRSE